jgi:hypothetical protein
MELTEITKHSHVPRLPSLSFKSTSSDQIVVSACQRFSSQFFPVGLQVFGSLIGVTIQRFNLSTSAKRHVKCIAAPIASPVDPIFPAFSQNRIGKLAPLIELTLVSPMNLEQK